MPTPMQVHMDRLRDKIIEQLLPDTCTVTYSSGTPTVSPSGIVSFSSEATSRTYLGSVTIPCRWDNSRSFRPEHLPQQELLVNEFLLFMPHIGVTTNDVITLIDRESETRLFEPTKITDAGNYDGVLEVLVTELQFSTGTGSAGG